MKAIEFSIELAQAFFSSEEAFPVDLDDAWKWLGYKEKRNALRQLTNNFEDTVDYTFAFKGESSPTMGLSPDKYFLTVECFKLLAMLAETANGKQVRKYFLECETVAKGAASKLALASAEIARLTALMSTNQGKAFSGNAAHRPDPAGYLKGMRCEATAIWADTGWVDPELAKRLMRGSMVAAELYLTRFINAHSTVSASAPPATPICLPRPKLITQHKRSAINTFYSVVARPTITSVRFRETSNTLHRDTLREIKEAVVAAVAALPPNVVCVENISLWNTICTPAAIAQAESRNFKFGLVLGNALRESGFIRVAHIRIHPQDAVMLSTGAAQLSVYGRSV